MGVMLNTQGEPRRAVGPGTAPPQVRFLVRMTYPNEAIRTRMDLCIDGVTHWDAPERTVTNRLGRACPAAVWGYLLGYPRRFRPVFRIGLRELSAQWGRRASTDSPLALSPGSGRPIIETGLV